MRFIFSTFLLAGIAYGNPFVFQHDSSSARLTVEFLERRGLHFEISQNKSNDRKRIYTTPMVLKESVSLEGNAVKTGNVLENAFFKVQVEQASLCVKVYDKVQRIQLAQTCPINLFRPWKGLSLYSSHQRNLYGLGQYFTNPGTADGDLSGRVWDPLSHTHGNALRGFSKGANSYAMFPVLYALGAEKQNFLFFYDNVYKQMWKLNQTPLSVESFGDEIRWFIYAADDVKELRKSFMHLTGKPPVPRKDVFGLWISEFGYESWEEVDEELADLRAAEIPVDGFSLDLQWFGGEFFVGDVDRSSSRFGTLEFDETSFPQPQARIEKFKKEEGLSLMLIEESYISKFLPEHRDLSSRGFMAKSCQEETPVELTANPWWGIGGMIDWTNPEAGDYWHDNKRQKLLKMGVHHHWTDLGEPEMYHEESCYYGFPELGKKRHADIHNIYNFKWLESIARGYARNKTKERPFMMSRSGTAGIQRFGASMWSGDIGANMGALTAHYNAQMHMSFSGIDYYGADIGGFHRNERSLDGDAGELYTQWFANAALFDFPVRAHTWNLSNELETSPANMGDIESNRQNILLRYRLFPYYYSLAHQAHLFGEGIVRPMVLEYPEDLNIRQMGNQKMIGPFLMAAMSARYGEKARDVYLPKGEWFDYHLGDHYRSFGSYIKDVPVEEEGIFRLPLFIKSGAIIPLMLVDSQTLNISGKRADGSTKRDFQVLVAPGESSSRFTVYEDDGVSTEYIDGRTLRTRISLAKNRLTIHAAEGDYEGALEKRNYLVTVFTKNKIKKVSFQEKPLSVCSPIREDRVCYEKEGKNKYRIRLGELSARTEKKLLFFFGPQ